MTYCKAGLAAVYAEFVIDPPFLHIHMLTYYYQLAQRVIKRSIDHHGKNIFTRYEYSIKSCSERLTARLVQQQLIRNLSFSHHFCIMPYSYVSISPPISTEGYERSYFEQLTAKLDWQQWMWNWSFSHHFCMFICQHVHMSAYHHQLSQGHE